MREHPAYRVVAGLSLMVCMVISAAFTLITDESLIRGGNGNVPLSWAIFQQPWDLMHGMYSGIDAWSIIGAWLIFNVYLILSVIEYFNDDKTMKTIVWILITIDGIGNFMYFKSLPTIYQLLLTGLVFFFLTYGGKKGISLFFSGINEMSASRKARYAEA